MLPTDRTRLKLPSSPLQVLLNLPLNPLDWRKSHLLSSMNARVQHRIRSPLDALPCITRFGLAQLPVRFELEGLHLSLFACSILGWRVWHSNDAYALVHTPSLTLIPHTS